MARNAVHPYHRPEHFEALHHCILKFHDSTFECVAKTVSFERASGSVAETAACVVTRLGR